jgi:hypothetical protein
MLNICISLFLFLLPRTITIQVGVIQNASLIASGTIINATCNQCICTMLTSIQNVRSFNCVPLNGTCELFTNYSSSFVYKMQYESNSTFYFLQLPSIATVATTHMTATSTYIDTSSVLAPTCK